MAELGFADLEYRQWFGLFAPAGTPGPILGRLHGELGKALSDPDTRQRLIAAGMDPTPSTAAELSARIKGDIAKWRKVIKVAGMNLIN
ncbi:MAG: hypothetical protein EXR27_01395 [Betaproteobacteria bacterium]|nr:hypothetical protein [Betaproteobacteria bacterium]